MPYTINGDGQHSLAVYLYASQLSSSNGKVPLSYLDRSIISSDASDIRTQLTDSLFLPTRSSG